MCNLVQGWSGIGQREWRTLAGCLLVTKQDGPDFVESSICWSYPAMAFILTIPEWVSWKMAKTVDNNFCEITTLFPHKITLSTNIISCFFRWKTCNSNFLSSNFHPLTGILLLWEGSLLRWLFWRRLHLGWTQKIQHGRESLVENLRQNLCDSSTGIETKHLRCQGPQSYEILKCSCTLLISGTNAASCLRLTEEILILVPRKKSMACNP